MRALAAGALAATLLSPLPAAADERWDHRGSLGLLIAAEGGGKSTIPFGDSVVRDNGGRYMPELGGTWAIGNNGNELKLLGNIEFGSPHLDAAVIAGYRGYFGEDRFKTFFDLDASFHVAPWFAAGPRLGFGAQYELTPVVGAYAALLGELGIGAGLRFSGQLMIGVQMRSYLLE